MESVPEKKMTHSQTDLQLTRRRVVLPEMESGGTTRNGSDPGSIQQVATYVLDPLLYVFLCICLYFLLPPFYLLMSLTDFVVLG
jgi:hypothetical protein